MTKWRIKRSTEVYHAFGVDTDGVHDDDSYCERVKFWDTKKTNHRLADRVDDTCQVCLSLVSDEEIAA